VKRLTEGVHGGAYVALVNSSNPSRETAMKTLITTLALALVVASATVNAAPRDAMNDQASAQETYKFDKHGNNGW